MADYHYDQIIEQHAEADKMLAWMQETYSDLEVIEAVKDTEGWKKNRKIREIVGWHKFNGKFSPLQRLVLLRFVVENDQELFTQ